MGVAVKAGRAVAVAETGASGQPATLAGKPAGAPPGGRTYLGAGKLRNAPKSAPVGTMPEEAK